MAEGNDTFYTVTKVLCIKNMNLLKGLTRSKTRIRIYYLSISVNMTHINIL